MSSMKINKRALHHYYRQVRFIRPWYFFLAALIFFFLGVYGMRQNNLHMADLREKVIQADKSGGNVEKPLTELRNYVYSHMNTDLSSAHGIDPPIQLKSEYDRLIKREQKKAEVSNEQVKARAKSICAAKHPGEGYNSPRVACVQDYVQKNAIQPSEDIPQELYTFDFVSPAWTPDFAGINLVLGTLFSALFIIWLALERWVRSRID